MEDHFRQSTNTDLSVTQCHEETRRVLTNFCPFSSLVPLNRTTTGTFMSSSLKASIIPSAIMSHLVNPPKMLTKIVFMRASSHNMLKHSFTVAAVALPPVSRKLAGLPPFRIRASTVFMARPAPLTVIVVSHVREHTLENYLPSVPMLPSPSSLIKFNRHVSQLSYNFTS